MGFGVIFGWRLVDRCGWGWGMWFLFLGGVVKYMRWKIIFFLWFNVVRGIVLWLDLRVMRNCSICGVWSFFCWTRARRCILPFHQDIFRDGPVRCPGLNKRAGLVFRFLVGRCMSRGRCRLGPYLIDLCWLFWDLLRRCFSGFRCSFFDRGGAWCTPFPGQFSLERHRHKISGWQWRLRVRSFWTFFSKNWSHRGGW